MRVQLRLPGGYQAIAYSPDGSIIVLDDASEQGTNSYLVSSYTGERLGELADPEGTLGRPIHYSFSPDGSTLAVARDYTTTGAESQEIPLNLRSAIDIYNTEDWSHKISLIGDVGFYTKPSFGLGDYVAAVIGNRDVTKAIVWDIDSGQKYLEIEGSSASGDIGSAEFIPGTNTLLVAFAPPVDGEGSVKLIEMDGRMSGSFSIGNVTPVFTAISPDGATAAISDGNRTGIHLYTLPDGEKLGILLHQDAQSIAWSPDGSLLAASGNDADITLFDLATMSEFLILTGHGGSVWGLSFAPGGSEIASASVDGAARVWNLSPEGLAADAAVAFDGGLGAFRINADGSELFAAMRGDDALLVDVATGEVISSFPTPLALPLFGIIDGSFSVVSGASLIESEANYRGRLYDRSGTELEVFDGCEMPRKVSDDGQYVVLDTLILPTDTAWCDREGEVGTSRVVDFETGQTVVDLGEHQVTFAEFSPGSAAPLVSVSLDFTRLEIYSIVDRKRLGTIEANELGMDAVLQHVFDPTGRYLGLGNNAERAVVIDLDKLRSGSSIAESVVFSHDAHKSNTVVVIPLSDGRVLTGSFDGIYRMWDMESVQVLWEIHVDGLEDSPSAAITADEQWLAYEGANSVVRFIPLDNDLVIERARAALTRTLTDDECTQYLHTDGCMTEPG